MFSFVSQRVTATVSKTARKRTAGRYFFMGRTSFHISPSGGDSGARLSGGRKRRFQRPVT